jgi:hypothetical protein
MYSVNDILTINDKKQIMIINNNVNKSILLIGSCRITPFLNYLINHDLFGINYNYLCVLVYNEEMKKLSEDIINNEQIKNQLFTCKYLISEYVKNFNYFNTQRLSEKCIFSIYDSFEKEIILPNWQDICLYSKDLIIYKGIKNEFIQLINGEIHSHDFIKILQKVQNMELERYYSILQKANFPELISFIKLNLQNIRITHMFNHPTNFYFLEIFRLIIEKYFLGGPYFLPQYIFDATKEEFLQSKEYDTKLTFYDYHYLGFRIPENYMDEIDSRNYILGFQ